MIDNKKIIKLLDDASVDRSLKLFNLDNKFTITDLNNQYKKLALKMHPDHGGSCLRMQELNNAKFVLENYLKLKSTFTHKKSLTRRSLTKRKDISNFTLVQMLIIILCYILIIFLF